MVNRRQKDDIFRLQYDLKIMSERMGRVGEGTILVKERLGMCCRSMNSCERKVDEGGGGVDWDGEGVNVSEWE
jgi:hypothetical protein